ncbi:hypothetical protein [Paenibacillus silagei]|uniref:SbsC C-terminal domain-containing protein n=1 Tax=Paenibacillus silagei TaxID=1670801 RepID=A0ABS4NKQ3_9BACL|nr:hypothetical protein [Paenibacillus silagei]MBP2110641.1 hypothetical protein [Paenibacillus silagei]
MKPKRLTKNLAAALASALLLTSTGITVLSAFPQKIEAAAVKPTTAFALFEQRLQKPSSLGLAQATLVNRIGQMTQLEANLAVLHLENALKAYLPTATKRMNAPFVQLDIKNIYTPGMTMALARSKVKRSESRIVLQDLTAMNYKLERGGGGFVPVIQYKSFKVFKPYLSKDLQVYIDLMAAESEQPTVINRTLQVDWYQVVERAVQYEAFVQTYKTSNRAAAMKEAFEASKQIVFNGAPNTPLFDKKTQVILLKAAIAYENTLSEAGPEQIEASSLLTQLDDFLLLVEQNGDKKTQAVIDYLEAM